MFKDITFIENITGQTITNLTETERLTLRLPSKTIDKYYTFGNSIITGVIVKLKMLGLIMRLHHLYLTLI
jgi:hypothetical protein